MNRRDFLQTIPCVATTLTLSSCSHTPQRRDGQVMTVRGPISPTELGLTLTHEHALANFQSYEEQQRHPIAYDRDEVADVVLPHLRRLYDLGCRTFVDATAALLGRDATLLRRLSEESRLHILTVTGNYAAIDKRHLPPHAYTDTPEKLAQRWIREWEQGIEGTGVYPGFIKLGFSGGPLDAVEKNLIRAAAIAHRQTGLTIGAHTGPAVSAFEQLQILDMAAVHPSAWIWIHSQNEKDLAQQTQAARSGAWISFDGVAPDTLAAHVSMVKRMRDEELLHRVLVSQDAGWYSVGEPRGGKLRTYDTIFTEFIPALRSEGFSSREIDTIFIDNPAKAFSIAVRAAR